MTLSKFYDINIKNITRRFIRDNFINLLARQRYCRTNFFAIVHITTDRESFKWEIFIVLFRF